MVGKQFLRYPVIDVRATGAHIRELRKDCGYSITELQDYFKFSAVQSIYHWENGASLPKIDNFLALSILLNTTINEIIICKKEIK